MLLGLTRALNRVLKDERGLHRAAASYGNLPGPPSSRMIDSRFFRCYVLGVHDLKRTRQSLGKRASLRRRAWHVFYLAML